MRVLILGVAPQHVADQDGAAALQRASVPSVPQVHMGTSLVAPGDGMASQERRLRCCCNLASAGLWHVLAYCHAFAPGPHQPSGGTSHHISSRSHFDPIRSHIGPIRSHCHIAKMKISPKIYPKYRGELSRFFFWPFSVFAFTCSIP